MWVPMDVLITACLSWGSSLLSLWVRDRLTTTKETYYHRGLAAIACIAACYVLGRIANYSAFGAW